ncbi:STE7 [Candida pseudojiufengensis]|uniref:STE7 n=1 Tax=Candida pseudojiufengensis TaxID=497109 RepID=UPI0022258AA3|nr:STE7 [Candida pseudojiufengensis]KAI5961370.1 STE7 [Candida pseudojiufengensis]
MNQTDPFDLSIESRDKTLPPIPKSRPQLNLHTNSSSEILETKTLRRKNLKQLSLSQPPSTNTTEETIDDSSIIRQPLSMRNRREQRPAPILNVKSSSKSNNSLSPISFDQYPSLSTQRSLSQPLIKTPKSGGDNGSSSSGVIISQTLSRPTSAGTSITEFNINGSNRNVDPESEISTELIMNQISNLDLRRNKSLEKHEKHQNRQTVISSISPTKSTSSNSPLDPITANNTTSTNHLFSKTDLNMDSPISTTNSIKLYNKDLLTLKQLGAGNSGSVSKILHIPTQKIMAKKIIHIDSKSIIQTQIIRELRILHECNSPYIIEFYGAFLNNNNTIVLCMEYCNCGSLDKILPLCENKQFPIFVLKKLSFAILSGLTYLYTTHKIIHRDIKPNNVLMTHKGEFKLCDFGVSRELTNSLAMADTFVGTSMYMSPERIQGLNYGVKSDVWSMGLMLIELATGKQVWSDDNYENDDDEMYSNNSFKGPEGILDLLQRIVNENPPSLMKKINHVTKEPFDSDLINFIDSCLIKNDSSRKSPWQLLKIDPFFEGVEEGLYDKEHKLWAKKIRKANKSDKDK